ncbi:Transposable element P transposase [Amphibalanus amphitrite]|uniref:Transposable element P transposase n=1 Tax=Amphibalanus amphitrite TaxID=1232801 RepID=A0A6A4VDB3_AMPAM|nr:Transposable element P transposase [Amphibalanus amphitrite]
MDENVPPTDGDMHSVVQLHDSVQQPMRSEERDGEGAESEMERALREAQAEAKVLRQRLASQGKVLSKYKTRCRRQKVGLKELEKKKKNISTADAMKKLEETCPPRLLKFLQVQLKMAGTKPKGRRYSDDELMEWLAIYHMGARAYRQLSRLFIMPSPRMLRKRMQDIQMLPGFQDALFSAMEHKMKHVPASDKMVVISFDEIQLTPNVTYHRGMDRAEGVEDLGTMGRTSRVADHALTFMVRGLTGRWKQAVGFFYSAGPAPAAVLEEQLKTCVRKLRTAGLRVVGAVCDMGKPNQELIKKRLGVTIERPYFDVDGESVIALYDPPHLFKCLRNCLYKHDIETPEGVMSWTHIKEFYEQDCRRSVRAAPKLRDAHIVLGAFSRMKVKLATQILSRSVASAMHLYADVGLLTGEHKVTANGLLRLNDAFDVLNSSRLDQNPNRRPFSKDNEGHHVRLLTDLSEWLRLWRIGGHAPSADSVQGLQLTISAVLLLWRTVSGELQSLATRRLTQDGLENFFGLVRQGMPETFV